MDDARLIEAPENQVMKPNYPRNMWWCAAQSDEVSRDPLGLWLLDEPVVLFRKEDGSIAALDNRCPHRWAPLSEGAVVGDTIKCPYHGFRFASDGACVEIPSQEHIPANCRVKSYPIIERHGLVWIWMGDGDRAVGQDLPVDTGWLADSSWSWVGGSFYVDANYQLLKENVLDLTHIPHVHPISIGANDWTVPPNVEVTETTVTYRQEFPPAKLAPVYGIPTGIGMERPVSRVNWGTSFSPAVHRGFVEITDSDPPPGGRSKFLFSVMHLVTPEGPTRFRYQWFMGWNLPLSEDYLAAMRANVPKGLAEDKAILEAVQKMILRDPRHLDYPEIIVRADQGAIQSRRKLEALLKKDGISSSKVR